MVCTFKLCCRTFQLPGYELAGKVLVISLQTPDVFIGSQKAPKKAQSSFLSIKYKFFYLPCVFAFMKTQFAFDVRHGHRCCLYALYVIPVFRGALVRFSSPNTSHSIPLFGNKTFINRPFHEKRQSMLQHKTSPKDRFFFFGET